MSRLVIEAGRTERHYWQDLWRYRELFYFLAWRDILVRYKQTAVGMAWAVLRPLITMLVLTVIFGRLANMPSDGVPYPLLVFAGMLPWQMFANALTDSGNSLVANSNLVSKIYFPRLIVPTGAVVVSVVDFLVAAAWMVVLFAFFGFMPDWRVVALPLFVVLALGVSLGAGFLVSALTVRYRDFRFIVPFVVQFGLYVSPVGFSSTAIPDHWRLLYALNPMVGVIDGFRWALLRGQAELYLPGVLLSFGVGALLLMVGIRYFRRTERSFADII
jgi:lipopolysaccharide transport system permease protein